MTVLKVTSDTSVLGNAEMARLTEAARGLSVDFASVTVTDREVRGTSIKPPASHILETGVWHESNWGSFVWGSNETGDLLESLLDIISNGSFPKPGQLDKLAKGFRHQLRDAMIIQAHAREKRDIFVTNDGKAFIRDTRRSAIEALCSTKIMTVDEFCDFCDDLRNRVSDPDPR